MKCMQLNPLPAELLMYLIYQECINRDTSMTLIMASIIRVSLLNCASPADRAPSVTRKPLIYLVPWLESAEWFQLSVCWRTVAGFGEVWRQQVYGDWTCPPFAHLSFFC